MGFYGNITNVNKSTFQFDKTYKNRKEMDDNAEIDNVFIGRYVLVDYDQENSYQDILDIISSTSDIEDIADQIKTISNTTKKVLYGYQLFEKGDVPAIDEEGNPILDENEEPTYITREVAVEPLTINAGFDWEKSYKLIGPVDQISAVGADEINDENFVVVIGRVVRYIHEQDGEIVTDYSRERFEDKKDCVLYVVQDQAYVKADAQNTGNLTNNSFLTNFQIDAGIYRPIGRGYDSTVWQKTYKNGEVKYVMVAELNSVVPSFDISVDAPTPVPLKPHFDTDSSNVYYKIHLQPSWGLRVKSANKDLDYSNEVELPSDIKGNFYVGNQLISNINDENLINHHTIDTTFIPDTDLAIYFDKAGFNRFVEQAPQYTTDEIQVLPTGRSQNDYYVTKDGRQYGKSEDTYELSMMLPSIGNSISDFWNIVYGPGTYKDSNGNYLWDKTSQKFAHEETAEEPAFKVRNTALEWNTAEGRRAVKQVGNSYTYSIEDLNTVAGTINSVHDLMGMIIRTSSSVENVNNWDDDKIYFVPDVEATIYDEDISYTIGQIVKISNKDKYYKALADSLGKDPEIENTYWEEIEISGKYYYKQKTYNYTPVVNYNEQTFYPSNQVVDLLATNENQELITQYFKKSDEQYDNYKDFYNTETPIDERIIYTYNNYYAVKNDADINLNAVYGTVVATRPDNLHPENYSVITDESEITSDSAVYYKENIDHVETYVLEQAARPTHNTYYKINFEPVSATDEVSFYAPNIFWLGTKNFTSAAEKSAWVERFVQNPNNAFSSSELDDHFTQLTPCANQGTAGWLNGLKSANQDNTSNVFYAFFEGVKIDPKNTTYEYVDSNLLSNQVELANIKNNEESLNGNSGYYKLGDDYYYKAVKANITELLSSPVILGDNLKFECGQYLNQKAGRVNSLEDENVLHTLMAWEESNVSAANMQLVQIQALILQPTRPSYIFDTAVYVPMEKMAIATNGKTPYWFRANLSNNKIGYQQETIISMSTEQGIIRRQNHEWYTFDENNIEVLVYYDLNDEYYYQDKDNNWIRETATMLRSDTDISKYYKIEWTPLSESNKVPFKSNAYYQMNIDGTMTPIVAYDSNIEKYYTDKEKYVIEDTNGVYSTGAKWNSNFDPPTGVTLGYRNEIYEARELIGFAKYINTIHGLILEINKKLLDGDELTRDISTVQGAINKLNDLIQGFGEIAPGQIPMYDSYGRMTSVALDGDNWVDAVVELNRYELVALNEEQNNEIAYYKKVNNEYIEYTTTELNDWNNLVANGLVYKFNVDPVIRVRHKIISSNDEEEDIEIDLNDTNKCELTINEPIIDDMGHVIANNAKTVSFIPSTLPNGFKTFSVGDASDSANNLEHVKDDVEAEEPEDTILLNAGNKWVHLAANDKTIGIGHLVSNITKTAKSDTDLSSDDANNYIIVNDIDQDEAGHITKNQSHKYILPNGFAKVETDPIIMDDDEVSSILSANGTQSTLKIKGNNWINTSLNNSEVKITHKYNNIVNDLKDDFVNIGQNDDAANTTSYWGLRQWIQDYVKQSIQNADIQNFWGVQANAEWSSDSITLEVPTSTNDNQFGNLTQIPLGAINRINYGWYDNKYSPLNNGIQVNQKALYRIQGSAAVRIADGTNGSNSPIDIVKAQIQARPNSFAYDNNDSNLWVNTTGERVEKSGNTDITIGSVSESFESPGAAVVLGIPARLVYLEPNDVIYLSIQCSKVSGNNNASKITVLLDNPSTYLLIEKVDNILYRINYQWAEDHPYPNDTGLEPDILPVSTARYATGETVTLPNLEVIRWENYFNTAGIHAGQTGTWIFEGWEVNGEIVEEVTIEEQDIVVKGRWRFERDTTVPIKYRVRYYVDSANAEPVVVSDNLTLPVPSVSYSDRYGDDWFTEGTVVFPEISPPEPQVYVINEENFTFTWYVSKWDQTIITISADSENNVFTGTWSLAQNVNVYSVSYAHQVNNGGISQIKAIKSILPNIKEYYPANQDDIPIYTPNDTQRNIEEISNADWAAIYSHINIALPQNTDPSVLIYNTSTNNYIWTNPITSNIAINWVWNIKTSATVSYYYTSTDNDITLPINLLPKVIDENIHYIGDNYNLIQPNPTQIYDESNYVNWIFDGWKLRNSDTVIINATLTQTNEFIGYWHSEPKTYIVKYYYEGDGYNISNGEFTGNVTLPTVVLNTKPIDNGHIQGEEVEPQNPTENIVIDRDSDPNYDIKWTFNGWEPSDLIIDRDNEINNYFLGTWSSEQIEKTYPVIYNFNGQAPSDISVPIDNGYYLLNSHPQASTSIAVGTTRYANESGNLYNNGDGSYAFGTWTFTGWTYEQPNINNLYYHTFIGHWDFEPDSENENMQPIQILYEYDNTAYNTPTFAPQSAIKWIHVGDEFVPNVSEMPNYYSNDESKVKSPFNLFYDSSSNQYWTFTGLEQVSQQEEYGSITITLRGKWYPPINTVSFRVGIIADPNYPNAQEPEESQLFAIPQDDSKRYPDGYYYQTSLNMTTIEVANGIWRVDDTSIGAYFGSENLTINIALRFEPNDNYVNDIEVNYVYQIDPNNNDGVHTLPLQYRTGPTVTVQTRPSITLSPESQILIDALSAINKSVPMKDIKFRMGPETEWGTYHFTEWKDNEILIDNATTSITFIGYIIWIPYPQDEEEGE